MKRSVRHGWGVPSGGDFGNGDAGGYGSKVYETDWYGNAGANKTFHNQEPYEDYPVQHTYEDNVYA